MNKRLTLDAVTQTTLVAADGERVICARSTVGAEASLDCVQDHRRYKAQDKTARVAFTARLVLSDNARILGQGQTERKSRVTET